VIKPGNKEVETLDVSVRLPECVSTCRRNVNVKFASPQNLKNNNNASHVCTVKHAQTLTQRMSFTVCTQKQTDSILLEYICTTCLEFDFEALYGPTSKHYLALIPGTYGKQQLPQSQGLSVEIYTALGDSNSTQH
jgi:hypothetical protein